MPEKLVKKNNTVIQWLLVAVVIIIILISIGKYAEHVENNSRLHDKFIETHEELKKMKKAYATSQKMLEDNGIKHNINEKVVNWAYKNAKSYIPKTFITMFLQEAKKYKTYLMIVAIIKEESAFDPFARSSAGAKGLGQIRTKIPESNKSVWLDMLIEVGIWQEEIDVYDYRKNIAAIDHILNEYKTKYGSWRDVLFHYVNGDKEYVTKVLSNYAELSLMLQEEEGELDDRTEANKATNQTNDNPVVQESLQSE